MAQANNPLVDAAQIVAGASAAIQAVVVIAAAAFAVRQVREASRSRGAAATMQLWSSLHTEAASERRRILYEDISPKYPEISDEQRQMLHRIVNDFHFIGYLVRSGLVEFELLAGLYYGTVIRCWDAAKPYIMDQREKRGTLFAEYFEYFYLRCLQYMNEQRPDERVRTWIKEIETANAGD